jgi:hypothetical protein
MSRRDGSDMIFLVVEDCTGRKLMRSKSSANDERAIANMFNSIINKYGMGLRVIKRAAPLEPDEEEFKW